MYFDISESLSGVVELSFEGGGVPSYLLCVSTRRPATSVQWELNDTVLNDVESSKVLNDPVTTRYTSTLKLRERQGGLYRCIVNSHNVMTDTTLTDFAELEVEGKTFTASTAA